MQIELFADLVQKLACLQLNRDTRCNLSLFQGETGEAELLRHLEVEPPHGACVNEVEDREGMHQLELILGFELGQRLKFLPLKLGIAFD